MNNEQAEVSEEKKAQVNTEQNEEEVKAEESAEQKKSQKEEAEAKEEEPKLKKVEEVDYKAKYYYIAAEMENLRKRLNREKETLIKFGNEDLLKNMLDVLDNFDRTVEALEKDEDEKIKNIVVGINMVRKMFFDTLAKYGLTQVETEGKMFDPNFHEAMAQQEMEGKKESEIIQVFQKGYILNGRLLRAAKVIVAK